jgi:hypothetical protein
MYKKENLEIAVRRAKLAWRRAVGAPSSTPADKRKALLDWKRAIARRDVALVEWRRALAERRKAIADRRKADADNSWTKEHADRRQATRRP